MVFVRNRIVFWDSDQYATDRRSNCNVIGSALARCRVEQARLDDAFERAIRPNPFFLRVDDVLQFQLERSAVVNIVAKIFLVEENLTNSRACSTDA
jgi:hypothetical protein